MNMTETVDVDVDPQTAFTAFTDEFDQWWGNGPIDAHQSWRLVERRIEPGVGGRLVEDYGDEERVTGTITVWEPPARLAWTTRNDVDFEVEFEALASGTRVRVTAHVQTDRDVTAALSMLRMAPQWFPRYLERRGKERSHYGRLHLALRSPTPAATARWLVDAFQLEHVDDLPTEEPPRDYSWIELRIGNGFIVLWGTESTSTTHTDSPFVYVDDLDAHLAHAEARGATIVTPINEHGFRSYTAADCEGRHWVFAQNGPRIGH